MKDQESGSFFIGTQIGQRSEFNRRTPRLWSTSDVGRLGPSLIDEDLTHRLGGGGIEVTATRPSHFTRPREFQIGLVDQRRRRQRVAGPLAFELPLGGAAKLIEDQGKKALRRRQVAVRCGSH
jgi:hypothetical protein